MAEGRKCWKIQSNAKKVENKVFGGEILENHSHQTGLQFYPTVDFGLWNADY